MQNRMDENKLLSDDACNQLLKLSQERSEKLENGIALSNGNRDSNSAARKIMLPEVKRLPPYTTWISLRRNWTADEGKAVVGRRRINYHQNGVEALICNDSEGEEPGEEDIKKEFKESEDYILQMTIKEAGSSDAVFDALAKTLSKKSSEIKERIEVLGKGENSEEKSANPLFDKDLNAAMDSLDKLFCRRCFVFDCQLHLCSQDLISPAEKQLSGNGPDEGNAPCGQYCYKMLEKLLCRDGKLEIEESVLERVPKNIRKIGISDSEPWATIEKSLYQKGCEIFGRNSCLIARNVMNGMKTCSEVFRYMNCCENELPSQAGDGASSLFEDYPRGVSNETTGNEIRSRGEVRRLEDTWKSAEETFQLCPQFNPCECKTACGKECSCNVNGTTCEKYCGCPKTCKNRFMGCYCLKSQCQSRQCPCFTANRECDPDVCRNCWIGCGDGSLGVPPQRGDNYECRNMKILLKQKQRVLFGASDVSGWGAFLKNSVAKNEYIGEYMGELISDREANKRGNKTYHFTLNDQYVIDSLRMGSKLKFANHSSRPNCFAKVMLVQGDHRMGIYAKRQIKAGEELFFDYHYELDKDTPAWAKKPGAPGSKKKEIGPSRGAAKRNRHSLSSHH